MALKEKKTVWDVLFEIAIYAFFTFFTLLCIFPFYYIFISSISSNALIKTKSLSGWRVSYEAPSKMISPQSAFMAVLKLD